MAALDGFLDAFVRGYDDRRPESTAYQDLIVRAHRTPPRAYPWSNRQRAFARVATERVAEQARDWASAEQSFDDGRVPRPTGRLRIMPPM
jgi:hypothetical protein